MPKAKEKEENGAKRKKSCTKDRDSQIINSLLVSFFVTGNISIRNIENPYLIMLLKHLAPNYVPPTRKTFMSRLKSVYTRAIQEIRARVSGETVCLTFDLATVLNSTRNFLVATCHYVDKAKKSLVTVALGVREMKGESCTNVDINDELNDMLGEVGINKNDIHGVVTDGGSNVTKAVVDHFKKSEHAVCVAHKINNIVTDTVKANKILTSYISDVKEIVTFFKHSPKSNNMLLNDQRAAGKKAYYLKQAVCTRWNSELNLIVRFNLLRSHVDTVLLKRKSMHKGKKNPPPSPIPQPVIETLTAVANLLDPFETLTTLFSGSNYVTSSPIISSFEDVHSQLQEEILRDTVARDFNNMLVKAVGQLTDIYRHDVSRAISQLLDPRFKGLLLLDDVRKEAKKKVEKEMLASSIADPPLEPPTKRLKLTSSSSGATSRFFRSRKETSECEMETYLSKRLEHMSVDPISYWLENADIYPGLAPYALKILLMPASSVASERLVSALNLVLSPRRSKLTSENAHKLVLMRSLQPDFWAQILGIQNAE